MIVLHESWAAFLSLIPMIQSLFSLNGILFFPPLWGKPKNWKGTLAIPLNWRKLHSDSESKGILLTVYELSFDFCGKSTTSCLLNIYMYVPLYPYLFWAQGKEATSSSLILFHSFSKLQPSMATQAQSAVSVLLVLNLVLYFIITVIASWAVNHALEKSFESGNFQLASQTSLTQLECWVCYKFFRYLKCSTTLWTCSINIDIASSVVSYILPVRKHGDGILCYLLFDCWGYGNGIISHRNH